MYWEPKEETVSREDLRRLQLERLQATLTRVSRNVPHYRKRFAEMGIDPDEFTSLADVRRLPFTTKKDLRDGYPYGLFAVPLREVVRLHASSGTTGKPTVVGYTRNDVKKWASLVARVLVAGGAGRDDVVQIALGYGLFTGGIGFHYGAEAIGAAVIPSSSGNTRRQAMIMEDYRTTTLVCTPSYALHLADALDALDINVNALSLRHGLFGAETWTEAMRAQIESRLKLTATDNYGLSEIMGPGVAGECLERCGMHVNEDHFLMEIVDPVTGEAVDEGEAGELVLTTLTKEAFPMIRFRTGDLTRILPGPCPCGRAFRRISRILGRADDMLTIRGTNVFPSQIEAVILEVEGMTPHYRVVVERVGALDEATVEVEAAEGGFFDRIGEHQHLVERLKKRLASELGVSMQVRLVEPKSLERADGKVKRVVDKREMGKREE
ncbi:phenylacetate--CoA ligase family protein [Desulfolutivibrio sulfoxidireducens]|uniref:phenylacetate--CoA ligase family protein n=1 Tax=Desulfolutivibrio sulfoxidireducens TaxID=2773299 RepID=UPI00159D717C|nr:phenylacetate--CoA ligase [Desulfolutivibrio sulfoxidireducens]QLA15045.1 AMP-binding protein [Desulfolutivibrio sulfoxidireducens]QLA18614.1 AMP-binding protein [Desulfolutivibrio sulfoxidireducens]